MKFKTNWKRFWTLSRSSDGFTLVELIVVIAILAILAGVAVPAYSGYIEKAKQAADQQLLATLNTAYASACLENGTDVHNLTSSSAKISLTGEVGAKKVDFASIQPTAYAEAFKRYYAGNENTEFTVIEQLWFDDLLKAFVDPATVDSVALSYGGGYIYISGEAAQAYAGSTFGSVVGSEVILGQVGYVTDFAYDNVAGGGTLANIVYSDDYMDNMAKAMGYTDRNDARFQTALGNTIAAKIEQLKADPANDGKSNDELAIMANNQVMANSAVLSAAQTATNMNKNDITTLLTATDTKTQVANGLTGSDTVTGMSNAALAYGMVTAYANSTGNAELIAATKDLENTENMTLVMNTLNDTAFKDYVSGEQGQADLDGYLAAMEMISNSSKDSNAASDVLVNGFDNEDLIALLQQATGSK